jgi:hypothetical protein
MSIKHITFDDYGYLEAGYLTNSFQGVLSLSDDADFLFVFNTCDAPLILRVPNGSASTKEVRLPSRCSFCIDCRTNDKRLAKGLIEVRYASVAPTTGEISVTVAR